MATHKVPQDVEAEDKLVGFLSLKQFIFTLLGVGFGYLTYFFFTKVHPISAVIWILPTIVCLVLGLYHRKDQPVEVFLASALRFYFKPRKRKWSLEGYEERVRITAPPKIEHHYTKNFSSEEATSRLSSLSRLMDSRGWTTKVASDWQNPQLATAAASDRLVQPSALNTPGIDPQAYMQPADIMDEQHNPVAQDFQTRIEQTDTSARQHALQTLQQASQSDDGESGTDVPAYAQPTYQSYPSMHQQVVQPLVGGTDDKSVAQPDDLVASPDTSQTQLAPQHAEPVEEVADDGSVEIKLH